MRDAMILYPNLLINKAKEILEAVDPSSLTEDEKEWRDEILWFWHHHAVSCSIWRYKDKEEARAMASHARMFQSADHPNKITELFELLLNDNLEGAEVLIPTIPDEAERETGAWLVEEYKTKGLF